MKEKDHSIYFCQITYITWLLLHNQNQILSMNDTNKITLRICNRDFSYLFKMTYLAIQ